MSRRDRFEQRVNFIYRRLVEFAEHIRIGAAPDLHVERIADSLMRRVLANVIIIEGQRATLDDPGTLDISRRDGFVAQLHWRGAGDYRYAVRFDYRDEVGRTARTYSYDLDNDVLATAYDITILFHSLPYKTADLLFDAIILNVPRARADLERAYAALEIN